MKHYDQIEWLLYKEKCVSKKTSNKMEEHLRQCNACLEIFLSLIDQNELAYSEKDIPEDFTNKVIRKIYPTKSSKTQTFKDILVYYVAAAAVLIVLTGAGFFQTLMHNLPQFAQTAIQKENSNHTSKIINWSEKITNKTSHFIYNLEITNKREDLR